MSNILSNTTSLQEVLEALQSKVAGGGEQATPTINVNSNGLITATAGTKSSTYQLAFQAAKTITPSVTDQVAVSSGYYTGGDITVEGDSNLVASNIKSGVSIFGVSGTYEGSGTGGSGEAAEYSEAEDAIISRTISGTYTNDRLTSIGNYVFAFCSSLASVSFPVCTNIGGYAFHNCQSLASVSFPVCTSISGNAFHTCRSLASVSFPVCTSIGGYAFYQCGSLISASFPVCTSIGNYAFYLCSSLTSISFPVCTNIDNNTFRYCYSLTSVSFPVCVNIGSSAFYTCQSLTSALFGSDIPSTSTVIKAYIYSSAFCYCNKLTNLTLYYPSVATLSNVNAFASTPMSLSTLTGSFGSIYVPTSLVDAYKSATNWAAYSARITAIPNGGTRIINFSVDGNIEEAEEGMTWQEWVNSAYNTNGYYISDNKVWGDSSNSTCYILKRGITVLPSDIIVEEPYSYTTPQDEWA